jgi:5,10-methylenetetrahydromethanopterin reductase
MAGIAQTVHRFTYFVHIPDRNLDCRLFDYPGLGVIRYRGQLRKGHRGIAVIEISCIFAPTMDTPAHIRLAEELGYARAWVYDSPLLWADPYITLALAAQQTTRVRLGVSVITPHLRHLSANAAAIANLHALAPGRIDLGVGSGFTSSALLGRSPAKWAYVETYVEALRSLLAGDTITWEGAEIALMHGSRSGIHDNLDIPIWIAAHGPRGTLAAQKLGANVVTNPVHSENPVRVGGRTCWVMCYGTVLDEGETFDDPRVLDAAGPGAALGLHLGAHGPLAGTPEQLGHAEALMAVPEGRRGQEIHRGHLIEPNEIDLQFLNGYCIEHATLTAPPAGIRGFVDALDANEAAGVIYQPGGSDIPRELAAFAKATGLTPAHT